jgi:hypothetical protein
MIPSFLEPSAISSFVIDGKSANYNYLNISVSGRLSSFGFKVYILDISGVTGLTIQTFTDDNFDVSSNSIYRTGSTLSELPIHSTALNAHSVGNESVFTTFDIDIVKIPTTGNSIVIVKDTYLQAES